MDALMMAMRKSRGDVPALNVDGVRLFRLTRMANANHVVDLLFDRLGPLKALHDRVQEAGCSASALLRPCIFSMRASIVNLHS